jgi:hypothetical protein
VMGFVRWEGGLPAQKAAVFMQNIHNFRKFIRRVEADEQGFFRFSDVPGDEPYFIFAVPSGDDNAVRGFEYFGIAAQQREVWRVLTLHPHRVVGNSPEGMSANDLFQLVLIDRNGERLLWTFHAGETARFSLTNVPHGRYRVQVSSGEGGQIARSLPFEVGDGQSQTTIRWSLP